MSDAIERAIELHDRALAMEEQGQLAEAEDLCREALTIFEREEGAASPDVGNLLHSLGGILERQGRFQEAGLCADRAVRIIEPLLPQFEGDEGRLILLHALGLQGTVQRQLGQYGAAEKPLSRAVEVAEGLASFPEELMGALNNLGVLCKFAGWFERGDAAYGRALDLALRTFGERHEIVATILHNAGGLAHARGDYAKAEEPSRRAWEIRRDLLGEDHPNTLADAAAYAAVLDGLKRYSESRPIYERALESYEKIFGAEHYEVAATLHNLAVVEQAEGNLPKALQDCRRSLHLKEKLLGSRHPDTALSAMNLGAMLIEAGEPEAAQPHLAAALSSFEGSLAADHPHISMCRELLAAASLRQVE